MFELHQGAMRTPFLLFIFAVVHSVTSQNDALRHCVIIYLLGIGGMPQNEEKEKLHASVHMGKDEKVTYDVEAAKREMSASNFLLGLIRLGRAFLGEYDWKDALTLFRGGKPDRDWITEDVLRLANGVSTEEYQKRLLKTKEACKEGMRITRTKIEVIDEELEKVEHELENH